jgi:hypothetical protein
MARLGTKRRALAVYVAAVSISILAGVVMLKLWKADLRVPFEYEGDALFHGMLVKSVVDHGWYLNNPSLGAPGELKLHDFPVPDPVHLLTIRAMALFSSDWALLFNIYFLLGFPLIAASSLAVLRHFKVSDGPAIVASVLYSFLPSRLIKGEGHLFLDVFYQVPLAILVMLWVCGPEPPLMRDGVQAWRPQLDLRGRRSLAALLICALVSCTSVYYAFFAACLLLAGAVWASFQRRSLANAAAGLMLCGVIFAGLVANDLPTLVYQHREGPNPEVGIRSSGEAELYGMKIAQLVLPASHHRLAALDTLNQRYSRRAPLMGENSTTTLGFAGVVGFLFLLGRLLSSHRDPRGPRDDLFRALAVLNGMAILLATVGGAGAIIALWVPQIRTYARMNVLIAFFALFATALLLEQLLQRYPRFGTRVLPVLLALGIIDQAPRGTARPYATTRAEYVGDADFVRQIESALPAGAAIFELPYISFPEGGPVNETHGYDLLRPTLHSRTLRWSFPTMRGRAGDRWTSRVAQLEPGNMLGELAHAGFAGIVIDRAGFTAVPSKLEKDLAGLVGGTPLVSPSQRYAFLDMRRYAATHSLPSSRSEGERALRPLVFTWGEGFSDLEVVGKSSFRWCDRKGEIAISNETSVTRRVRIQFTAIAANPPAHLRIEGELGAPETIDLPAGGAFFSRELEVSPGRHVVRFQSDSEPVQAPSDPRTLIWHADSPVIEELPPAAKR